MLTQAVKPHTAFHASRPASDWEPQLFLRTPAAVPFFFFYNNSLRSCIRISALSVFWFSSRYPSILVSKTHINQNMPPRSVCLNVFTTSLGSSPLKKEPEVVVRETQAEDGVGAVEERARHDSVQEGTKCPLQHLPQFIPT